MPVPPTGVPKPRKPRPSRARGLRTTTGCLTCRKRRVKCDESKPRCGPCTKSDRECVYAPPREPPLPPPPPPSNATVNPADEPPVAAHDAPSEPTSGTPSVRASIEASASASASAPASTNVASPTNQRPMGDIDPQLFNNSPELHFDLSPLTIANSLPSPHGSGAPLDWYDLLAEDAINNIQKHNLGFDGTVLSRRQSPAAETPSVDTLLHSADQRLVEPPTHEPWNTPNIIPLADDELNLLRYYVNEVGPILDLFDPERHFATCVPRLAVHNVGLLKSLLAVAARHMALHSSRQSHPSGFNDRTPGSNVSGMADETGLINPLLQVATQYYYDTLRYLSQNLFYPAYSQSDEIIATAILISTYEMFDAEGSYSDGAWERHLRGIFWIQKFQGNNGESKDGLRRAAWWSWIRQDIWVAFREGRRVLTIFRPTKRLVDLTPDELATRILYLCARCVDYASTEKKTDMSIRIEQGDKLLHALDDWHRILPSSFQPVYRLPPSESGAFSPVWIHPPMYAAAMQTFHFARIIVIISQPSTGGMNIFRQRQRCLDDSVETICGIAMMHQGQDLSSAFMNFQAVYAAGLCVQTPAKQSAILQLLEKILDVGKFPPKTLLTDLANYWREGS